jgi:hypothetical protein
VCSLKVARASDGVKGEIATKRNEPGRMDPGSHALERT